MIQYDEPLAHKLFRNPTSVIVGHQQVIRHEILFTLIYAHMLQNDLFPLAMNVGMLGHAQNLGIQ